MHVATVLAFRNVHISHDQTLSILNFWRENREEGGRRGERNKDGMEGQLLTCPFFSDLLEQRHACPPNPAAAVKKRKEILKKRKKEKNNVEFSFIVLQN